MLAHKLIAIFLLSGFAWQNVAMALGAWHCDMALGNLASQTLANQNRVTGPADATAQIKPNATNIANLNSHTIQLTQALPPCHQLNPPGAGQIVANQPEDDRQTEHCCCTEPLDCQCSYGFNNGLSHWAFPPPHPATDKDYPFYQWALRPALKTRLERPPRI